MQIKGEGGDLNEVLIRYVGSYSYWFFNFFALMLKFSERRKVGQTW
jgi:hypothetical protein